MMGVTVEVFRVEGASVQGTGFKCFGFRFRGPERNSNSNGDLGTKPGTKPGCGVPIAELKKHPPPPPSTPQRPHPEGIT